MMQDLRDIEPFLEVARLRSFTKAAQALGMPASTLSRRIADLERRLGTRLLLRTTRRVEPTEAGVLFLARCEEIVGAARAASSELQDFARRPRGLLRVSLTPDFGAGVLAPMIAGFSRLYPEIEIDLDLSPRRVDLAAERVDVAIRIGMPSEPYLFVRRLHLARRALVASPDYLARAGLPESPADLAAHDCLSVSASDGAATWVLSREGRPEEVAVRGRIRANTPAMVLRLAQEGAGIAAVDEAMAAPALAAGWLGRVLEAWDIGPVPIYGVTATPMQPLKTRLFLDHVQAGLAALETRPVAASPATETQEAGRA